LLPSEGGRAGASPDVEPEIGPDQGRNSKEAGSLMKLKGFGEDEVVEFTQVATGMQFKCRACGFTCHQLSRLKDHLDSEMHLNQVRLPQLSRLSTATQSPLYDVVLSEVR
jgi:hypothetical protein